MDGGILQLLLNSEFLDSLMNWASVALLTDMENCFPTAVNTVCNNTWLSSLLDIVTPIGIMIMIIYFSIDLMSKSATSNFSTEIFVRSLIKLVIGYIIIINCDNLSKGIIDFGDALVEMIKSENNFTYTSNSTALIDYIKGRGALDGGYWLAFKLITKAFVELAMGVLIGCMVRIVAYSRAIKLFVYRAVLPMAVADIFGKGIYHGAVTPIKKILALAVQYPTVYIMGILTCIFINGVDVLHTNWLAMLGQIVMIFIVVIKTIKDSSSDVMQMFG